MINNDMKPVPSFRDRKPNATKLDNNIERIKAMLTEEEVLEISDDVEKIKTEFFDIKPKNGNTLKDWIAKKKQEETNKQLPL